MKFTIADLRLLRAMVDSAAPDEETPLFEYLRERQPAFCGLIDEVGSDPRSADAYRCCGLFCSLALERAERARTGPLPPLSRHAVLDVAGMIARQEEAIANRARTYRGRILRHVLKGLDLDDDDTAWLQTTLSAFLFVLEKLSVAQ